MATAWVPAVLSRRRGLLNLCAKSLTLSDASRERLPGQIGKPSSTSREGGAATVST
jgi:hypothetical protein